MKIPPPGERYLAASWIAVAVALLAALAGSVAVWTVWDALPARVALRQTYDEMSIFVSPLVGVVISSVATLAACLVWLAWGVAVHRSSRHQLAGLAAGSAVAVAVLLFGLVWEQGRPADAEVLLPLVAGLGGTVVGVTLYWWSRPPSTLDETDGGREPVPTIDVPGTALLAWVGTCRMSWVGKLLSGGIRMVPICVIYTWLGMLSGYWWMSVVIVVPAFALLIRDKQLAVDYSGVGLRKRNGTPSPVPIREIRAASVVEVSVLRDFGSWGNVKASDGRQGWITRSGEALAVHRIGKPDFVYTVDGAEEAAAVLNTLVVRYQSRDQTLTA